MTQPPQDGSGGSESTGEQPPSPQPPQQSPQQPQEPPQQPTQPPPGAGYPSQPQQPPQQGQFGQPYGYPGPYGQQQPGYGYPPPPPPAPSNSGKITAIVAAAVVALLLVAGGVYVVLSGGDSDDVADPKASKSPTPEASSEFSGEPTGLPTDIPSSAPTGDFGDPTPGPHSKEDGFKGQWQDDGGKTLTIGDKLPSGGSEAGKYPVSYIDPGGDGFCIGLGDERSGGSRFRIAVRCGTGEGGKNIAGNSKQDGDSITITWDEGGSDTLDWIGQ
jgi:hypothetical protein